MPVLVGIALVLAVFMVVVFVGGLSFLPTRRRSGAAWASPEAPAWGTAEGTGRRRVLLVEPHGAGPRSEETNLRAAGYDVATCPGPIGGPDRFPFGECPMLHGKACSLVEQADAVVFGLELDDPASRRLLRAYRERRPAMALCVCTSDREADWFGDLLAGSEVLASSSHDDLPARLDRALTPTG